MRKFTVRLKPVKKGIRQYYYSQMRIKRMGISFWTGFSAYKHCGSYTLGNNSLRTKSNALSEIDDLIYIYGEDNVEIVPYKL